MCLYPRLIANRKYRANKKNGGVIPPVVDSRVLMVPVGCQMCIECRNKKARDWTVRLQEEVKHDNNCSFVTLTFSNESIVSLSENEKCYVDGVKLTGYKLDNAICKVAIRLFLERWRKKYKKSVRHWFITELGHDGTENIHIHGLIWTKNYEELSNIWQYGWVWDGKTDTGRLNYVNNSTIAYISKYITKVDLKNPTFMGKILCSPGIGRGYDGRSNKFNDRTNETYRTNTGHKISLPIYYRNKIYSEKERELLWIQKLDKAVRYVCGERVSIKNEDKTYYNMVEFHRSRSIELGYFPPEYLWSKSEYEEQRRMMMQSKRGIT